MTKPVPDIVIDRLGTHLFRVTRKDGTSWLRWDWDRLLEEVRAATSIVIEQKPSKKNIVAETEEKVAKSRAKKTDAVVKETKKPAAKKPAAKKATTKKSK
jgi:hypothetical protein